MWLHKGCHPRAGRVHFPDMSKLPRKAADAVVLAARLYRELAVSALSLLQVRRPIREF
ncbi:MAG: hypothetical protein VCC67_01005 [Myxococcota bacterium]